MYSVHIHLWCAFLDDSENGKGHAMALPRRSVALCTFMSPASHNGFSFNKCFVTDKFFEVQESDNFSGNFYNAFLMSPKSFLS